jgi:hypothetical protein
MFAVSTFGILIMMSLSLKSTGLGIRVAFEATIERAPSPNLIHCQRGFRSIVRLPKRGFKRDSCLAGSELRSTCIFVVEP